MKLRHIPLSAKQRALLDARWKAYRAGTAQRITLAELERRLLRTRRT